MLVVCVFARKAECSSDVGCTREDLGQLAAHFRATDEELLSWTYLPDFTGGFRVSEIGSLTELRMLSEMYSDKYTFDFVPVLDMLGAPSYPAE